MLASMIQHTFSFTHLALLLLSNCASASPLSLATGPAEHDRAPARRYEGGIGEAFGRLRHFLLPRVLERGQTSSGGHGDGRGSGAQRPQPKRLLRGG